MIGHSMLSVPCHRHSDKKAATCMSLIMDAAIDAGGSQISPGGTSSTPQRPASGSYDASRCTGDMIVNPYTQKVQEVQKYIDSLLKSENKQGGWSSY